MADLPPERPPRVQDADHDQQRRNPLQFVRWPIIYKQDMDIELFLRRFQSYVQAIGADVDEIPNMLITCLDDNVLKYVERHLRENITYDELVDVLRRELGIDRANREDYKAKLRRTMRGRNEKIRPFYVKLYDFAQKAYEEQAVRDANLRDAFINNLQDSQISARLREHPEVENEEILELAVTLMNCKNASLPKQSPLIEANGLEIQGQENPKLDQIIDLLGNLTVGMEVSTNNIESPNHAYEYTGNRTSAGLQTNQGNSTNQQNYFNPTPNYSRANGQRFNPSGRGYYNMQSHNYYNNRNSYNGGRRYNNTPYYNNQGSRFFRPQFYNNSRGRGFRQSTFNRGQTNQTRYTTPGPYNRMFNQQGSQYRPNNYGQYFNRPQSSPARYQNFRGNRYRSASF